MATVPGICDECGSVFGAEALAGAEGRGIKLGGARIGPCPSCGGAGSAPEGVFDLVVDTLQIVEMAAIEKVVFDAVIEVLEGHASGEVSDEGVIQKVEEKAPSLVPAIKDYLSKSDPASWLALLISVLMLFQSPAATPSAEEIAHEIWTKQQQEKRIERHTAKRSHPKRPRGRSPKIQGRAKHWQSRKRR